jgi:hypothetical protein
LLNKGTENNTKGRKHNGNITHEPGVIPKYINSATIRIKKNRQNMIRMGYFKFDSTRFRVWNNDKIVINPQIRMLIQ